MATMDRVLVERGGELEEIERALDHTSEGDGRVILIEGPAGIGKSALLEATRALAGESRYQVLAARSGQLEREFAFGVVRQLFEAAVADPEERERAFAGAAEPARAVLEAPGAPRQASAAEEAPFATLHGLYWLTLNLAGDEPLLLAVDDLHWCDAPSLRFLAYLARRVEGSPIAIGASLRTAEPGADFALIGEIAHSPSAVSIRPAPLTEAGVAELVRDRLGAGVDDAFCEVCASSSAGNPLLLRQLLRALESEGVTPDAAHTDLVRSIGPRAVARTVLLRLARLPEEAAAVAGAVAVLGDGTDLRAVAELAGVEPERAVEATRALAQAEILQPDLPLGFVHPLVRDAIYRELSPGERELQHARAAALLSGSGAQAESVASHLLVIPRRGEDWVVDVLEEAARTAMRKGAPESAVVYLRKALEEPLERERRARILFELGLGETHTDGGAAAEHLGAAYELLDDPLARGRAAFERARTLMFMSRPEECVALAEAASAELPPDLVDLRQSLDAIRLMAVYFGAGDPETLVELERYREGREGDGPGAKMLAALTSFAWANSGGPAEPCCELAREALADRVLFKTDNGLFWVTAIVMLAMADREEALDQWQVALAEGRRRGSMFAELSVNLWLGNTLLEWGDLVEAEELLTAALGEMGLWGADGGMVMEYPTAILARAHMERGDLEAARAVLTSIPHPTGSAEGMNLWRRSHVELLLAEGSPEQALEAAEDYAEHVPRDMIPARAPWRSLLAETLDRVGRGDEGIALVEEELEVIRHWGVPGPIGRTLRVLGVLKRERGLAELREAEALLAQSPRRVEHAKALAALGSELRRGRKPTESREPLRRALELAERCGAERLAEHVRTELHAAGARPRTTALSGPDSLTASERRVVELAVDGLTNRDIAQTLYVTPKTVEVHLTSAYRKLGIRSRRELAGAMAAA